jgi:hypothetical protein
MESIEITTAGKIVYPWYNVMKDLRDRGIEVEVNPTETVNKTTLIRLGNNIIDLFWVHPMGMKWITMNFNNVEIVDAFSDIFGYKPYAVYNHEHTIWRISYEWLRTVKEQEKGFAELSRHPKIKNLRRYSK